MPLFMDAILYKIISGFFSVIGLIPRDAAIRIAGFLGRVFFVLDKRHRDVALENLTHVFGAEKSSAEIREESTGLANISLQLKNLVNQFELVKN